MASLSRRGSTVVARGSFETRPTFAPAEWGDVLILEAATREASAALAVVGALLTERGGALSNLATLARERGVPYEARAFRAPSAVCNADLVLVDAVRAAG